MRIDQLIQIDLVMAEAVRRGGAWIACRPGCYECCLGPFPISTADAQRLRDGLSRLDASVARRVRERAASYIAMIRSHDQDGLPEGVDDVPCPALDPVTGRCDLYDAPDYVPHVRAGGKGDGWRDYKQPPRKNYAALLPTPQPVNCSNPWSKSSAESCTRRPGFSASMRTPI